MKPEAYLEFAAKLLPTDEAPALRSCISRAYYAAFHVVYEVQLALKAKPTHSHEVVSDRFFNSATPEVKELGIALNLLRRKRNSADYGLKETHIEKLGEANSVVRQARWLIETTKAYYADNGLREKMKEAIRADRALRGY